MPRECGECRACCYVLGVEEVEKKPFTHCTHECPNGCAIYKSRPKSCAGYFCMWLIEGRPDLVAEGLASIGKTGEPTHLFLKDEERPDKSGLIFEVSAMNGESAFEKEAGFSFFIAKEVRPGAAEGYWGQKILKRLSKKSLVIIATADGKRRAIGPPDRVRAVGNFLQRVRVVEK